MFARFHDVDQLFGAFNLFNRDMERFFSAGFPYRTTAREAVTSMPLTNIYDNGESLLFQAEIPGIAKDDLVIQLHGKHLEVKGERKHETPEGYDVHRQDLPTGNFTRFYTLPVEVDADKVTSSLDDGILTITLPKAAVAQKKQIAIH